MDFQLSAEAADSVNKWVRILTTYWKEEVPTRIHMRQYDEGGAPEWNPEFARWIEYDRVRQKNPEIRLRTTRAFRKLRKKNVREFEVLYRTVVLGHSVTDTAEWLTQRAIKNDKPERYTPGGVQVLLYSAAHKVMSWL
jgi:hypothetical protein